MKEEGGRRKEEEIIDQWLMNDQSWAAFLNLSWQIIDAKLFNFKQTPLLEIPHLALPQNKFKL